MGMGAGGGGGGGGGGGTCYMYPDAPATPGIVTPDVTFRRGMDMNIPMVMDDGRTVNMWGFPDLDAGPMGAATFPSAPMVLKAGQIAYTVLTVPGNNILHTIHHHGIEPSMESDGVGHITHDVQGTYTYQWRPMHAGTYFYHCHTNTVLHAEMGMYGGLLVLPADGSQTVTGDPATAYDVQAIWAVDEIDSSWHNLMWNAGTCGADVGLNTLNPDYFIITGVDGAQSALDPAKGIAATVTKGQKLLVRYICAGYLPQHIRFGGLTATVVSSDGRQLPQFFQATELRAVSAERYDCIFDTSNVSPGTYIVEADIIDWISGNVLGTAKTSITVA